MANNTTDSIYTVLGGDPELAGRFGHAMMAYANKPEHAPVFITDYFDWASLGPAQVVHIGGGQGHFALALASRFSNLSVVVQDIPQLIGDAETRVPG